jgi:hypothetical protein
MLKVNPKTRATMEEIYGILELIPVEGTTLRTPKSTFREIMLNIEKR